MVFIRFESFILAHLLVSFALQTLSVHGVHHQGLLFEQEVAKTSGICSRSKEVRIGGRKMGMISKADGQMASRSSTSDAQKLNVEEGFVAFTADYHMAKRHPPRNN
ncbi:hypothetical protein L1987_46835 [Smallanthus sonchifolius]|uniref:Uncharacterized protein n=1 Tax=Smallanthus sonchifolius TaxID=185202 RepID=A0ACB9G2M6_9ASTR|nr:hypothetical protein L1987_46835 [Smallanthus sonchifolius]